MKSTIKIIQTSSFSLILLLTAISYIANAQRVFHEGTITLNASLPVKSPGKSRVEMKYYFRNDSNAYTFSIKGIGDVKFLQDAKLHYFALLVNPSDSSVKKAGIASPVLLEKAAITLPHFVFTYTTETKLISGFSCKKIIATDSLTKKTYNVWATDDISIPFSALPKSYEELKGVPIQYTSFYAGASSEITILTISDKKAPSGTFGIANDYKRLPIEELITPMIKM